MRHPFVAMTAVFAVGITVTGNNAFSQQEAFKEQVFPESN